MQTPTDATKPSPQQQAQIGCTLTKAKSRFIRVVTAVSDHKRILLHHSPNLWLLLMLLVIMVSK